MNDSVLLCLCAEKLDRIVLEHTDGEISLLNSSTFTLPGGHSRKTLLTYVSVTFRTYYDHLSSKTHAFSHRDYSSHR